MILPYAPPGRLAQPPRGVVGKYLSIERPGEIPLPEIAKALRSSTDAKVFCNLAVRHGLLIRLRWGVYAAPAPEVAFASWAFPAYFRKVLVVSSAFRRLRLRHAFACLAALAAKTDWLPAEPLAVVRLDDFERVHEVPAFGLANFAAAPLRLTTGSLQWSFVARRCDLFSAAKVLAAVGLPREVAASRRIAGALELTPAQAGELNALGVRSRPDTLFARPGGIRAPRGIESIRSRFAEMARLRALQEA